eukprot:6876266-Ditylum_brightwellii.AAC.1
MGRQCSGGSFWDYEKGCTRLTGKVHQKVLRGNARAIRQLHQSREVDKAFRIGVKKVSRKNRQLMRGEVLDTKDCQNEIKGNYQGMQGTQKRHNSLIRRKRGIERRQPVKRQLLIHGTSGKKVWIEGRTPANNQVKAFIGYMQWGLRGEQMEFCLKKESISWIEG